MSVADCTYSPPSYYLPLIPPTRLRLLAEAEKCQAARAPISTKLCQETTKTHIC